MVLWKQSKFNTQHKKPSDIFFGRHIEILYTLCHFDSYDEFKDRQPTNLPILRVSATYIIRLEKVKIIIQ